MANDSTRSLDALPDTALLSVREIAQHLGVSQTWVWRATRAGRIPQPVRLSAKCTRWTVGPVRTALAALGAGQ